MTHNLRMHILHAITYYKPHISGMAVYAERLCRALAGRGHQMTVLTAQLNVCHPRREIDEDIAIVRIPVTARIGKGVLLPSILHRAWRLLASADILHLHLPHLDAPALALLARLRGVPVIVTHHCDVVLPRGARNAAAQRAIAVASRLSVAQAHAVVSSSADYARHSPLLRRYLSTTHRVIPPPVDAPCCAPDDARRSRKMYRLHGRPLIGMVGRVSAEKGWHVLLDALPLIAQALPDVRVIHAGPTADVPGESRLWRMLAAALQADDAGRVSLLGVLDRRSLAAFYRAVDVLVMPSINGTESFGLAQAEALLCGTPVVASDLPGMRVPVRRSGFGLLVAPGNPVALAEATIALLAGCGRRGDSAERCLTLTPRDVGAASSATCAAIHAALYAQQTVERR